MYDAQAQSLTCFHTLPIGDSQCLVKFLILISDWHISWHAQLFTILYTLKHI